MKNSYITATDQFCGAGGSSIGATKAGVEVRLAMNHWKLAIDTHNTNFPKVDHVCTDISATDPRRYPSTNILITSPECTNHSLAKGKPRRWYERDLFGNILIDPAEERSRATMWDVPRFAEYHDYEIIVVENVVDAGKWRLWDSWLSAMHALGYQHQVVYFNSMFAWPTPQSRDRMYTIFWKRGNKTPDLDIRPLAPCEGCGKNVEAIQTWKRGMWGRYKAQYFYRCPHCAGVVTPYYYAAFNAGAVTDPLHTVTATDRAALVGELRNLTVEDMTFRMLQPHEIGRAMAFPDTYQVLGNSRDKVKQYGNAVTPPAMEILLNRCVETLR